MTLLTITQAARMLDLSRERVQQLIWTGILPATKVGRFWVVREKDLNKARARKTKPGPGRVER